MALPHYFTSEVTARLCKVMSGRAVNRSPGAPQSSAKSQSLSHTAFQDQSDESMLVCQYPGPGWLDLTALPGPRLDPDKQFAAVVEVWCLLFSLRTFPVQGLIHLQDSNRLLLPI